MPVDVFIQIFTPSQGLKFSFEDDPGKGDTVILDFFWDDMAIFAEEFRGVRWVWGGGRYGIMELYNAFSKVV